MTLTAGTRLGPYEIMAPLGAGGMGEVYRAKDTRLGRDVAIKVLPTKFSSNPELRERFEREARAISSLNHARICTLHDVGHQDGVDFLVMEYLEGESLAEKLRKGALPLRETLKIGMEVCEALDVAHRAGIVHRDLKPANIMLTKSGAKLMDFGLAKASATAGSASRNAPLLSAAETISGPSPMSPLTGAGQVIGTIQYMSPEQIEGKEADARSDVFALGAVLYEMATGQRPFEGKSQISVASAILEKDPTPIRQLQPLTPRAFERVVSTCLQKNPDERFQSARDIRLELRWIAENPIAETPAAGTKPSELSAAQKSLRLLPWALAASLAIAVAAGAWLYHHNAGRAVMPAYRQVTFERGFVYAARFAPDERSVVYSASWEGQPLQVYLTHPGSPESRALNLLNSTLFAASEKDLAISIGCRNRYIGDCQGTLALVPISGGAPREIAEEVVAADWTSDGSDMAIVRHSEGKYRVEYPRGKVIHESSKPLGFVRIAPDGKSLAFAQYVGEWGDAGQVFVLDRNGKELTHSQMYVSLEGVAWPPSSEEVWLAGTTDTGWADAIFALRMNGQEHVVLRLPGMLRLHDISRDGAVLLSKDVWRSDLMYRGANDKSERKLSWLDYAQARDITDDGKLVSFADWGQAAGTSALAFVRSTDGSPAVKLGTWDEPVLSPDGTRVLAVEGITVGTGKPSVVPIGVGEIKKFEVGEIQDVQSMGWMPDGKSFYYGADDGHGFRMYLQDLAGGKPRAVTPVISVKSYYFETHLASPDGKFLFVRDTSGNAKLFPVAGGPPQDVAGWMPDDVWITWAKDGKQAYVFHDEQSSANVYRLDVTTGKRGFVAKLAPADTAGVTSISSVLYTPDGKAYAYSGTQELSELFIVDGVR
jgi:tRNA A-37 threonylcarbamoyl transferase component Bud32/Tol biopolymer transport system component